MKFPNLPKHASEFQAWLDNVIDAVVACARDGKLAFAWIARLLQDGCTFEELGNILEQFQSLDDKIRAGFTKHLVGSEAEKNKELVSSLLKKRDELRKPSDPLAMPVQITGLQLIFCVKQYFRIHDNERVTFELSALTDLEYSGDAKLGVFKDHWDKMVRNCVTQLSDRDKLGILEKKLKGSERLKPHLHYRERLPENHPDNTHEWLSSLIDKLVADDRKRRNTESLVLEASGKHQTPKEKKPGAPGRRKGHEGGGDATTTTSAGPATAGGHAQDPKGKGKGKGKKGKEGKKGKKGDDNSGNASGSDSESGQWPGKTIAEIPEAERCCAHYLWVKKDGSSLCSKFNAGKECHAPHTLKPSKAMLESKVYAKLKHKFGPPNCPASGPKKPGN